MSLIAGPGEQIKPILTAAPQALVGQLTIAIRALPAGTIVTPATTAGIVEYVQAGGISNYQATLAAPAQAGGYELVWTNPVPAPAVVVTEPLQVTSTAAAPRYATLADVRLYTTLAAGIADADLQAVLLRAERDVDGVLRPAVEGYRETTGLRYDPVKLEQWRRDALNRAVCAQAEYRLEMGDDFFIRGQHQSVRGPEFATTGQLPYIGPKVPRELDGTGLMRVPGIGSLRLGPGYEPGLHVLGN